MKAVNLIPAELRKGDSGGGHSGGLVYAVLGALGVLVVMAAMFATFGKMADDRKAEAAQLQNEAVQVESRAAALAHYESAAAAARERVEKVRSLAATRFEWADTFREVSRILPEEAWVTSMVGTIGTNVSVDGGGNPLRGSENAPALELIGCTGRQDSVAKLMAQLRAMDGVTRVALSSSEKGEQASATAGSGGDTTSRPSSGDCRSGSDRPQFNLVVFFRNTGQQATGGTVPGTPGTAGATGAAPGTAGSAPSTTGTSGAASGSTAAPSTPPATPSTSTGAAQ